MGSESHTDLTTSYDPSTGLGDAVDRITQLIQQGVEVEESYIRERYPELADELVALLPSLEMLAAEFTIDSEANNKSDTRTEAFSSSGSEVNSVPRVIGDFELVRELGRGGMGVVFEAVQTSLRKRVALKLLPFAGILSEKSLTRFKNESRVAAHLSHPNIVPVIATGSVEGVHYYAMQLIEGSDLSQVIERLNDESTAGPDNDQTDATNHSGSTVIENETLKSGSVLSTRSKSSTHFTNIARIMEQVAMGLDHAHECGVVHRDIKPSNIMIDDDGKAWLTDFGLAQVQGDAELTMTGDLLGTVRYMSPEQAYAKRVVVDHRTDIYSLGVTIYELITLEKAFKGDNKAEILRKIAFEDPPRPRRLNRRIPVKLETIVQKAIAKNPDDRYVSAGALAEDLHAFVQNQPITARRPSPLQQISRWCGRHRNLVAWGTGIALVTFMMTIALAYTFFGKYQSTMGSLAVEKEYNEKLQASLRRAESGRLSALSTMRLTDNPGLALLLANQAVLTHDSIESRQALFSALLASHERKVITDVPHTGGAIQYSNDGKKVLVTFHNIRALPENAPARIWDAQTGKQLMDLKSDGPITSAAFSPSNGRIVTTSNPLRQHSSWQEKVRPPVVWDALTGNKLIELKNCYVPVVTPLSFHPKKGNHLLAVAPNHDLVIMDTVEGAELGRFKGADAPTRFASFSPDGSKVLAIGSDNTLRVWDGSAKLLYKLDSWQKASGKTSFDLKTASFSPDAKYLVTGSRRQGTQLWTASDGKLVNKTRWQGELTYFAPNGESVLFSKGVSSGKSQLYDIENDRLVFAKTGIAHGFSADGRFVITSDAANVKVLSAVDGSTVAELRGHEKKVNTVAFAPDGRNVFSAARDSCRIWSVQTVGEGWKLDSKLSHYSLASFASKANRLLVTKQENVHEVFSLDKAEPLRSFKGTATTNANLVARIIDDKLEVANLSDGKVEFEKTSIHLHNRYVIAVSADAVVTSHPTQAPLVILYKEGRSFQLEHRGLVLNALIENDELITASRNGNLDVWELKTGKRKHGVELHGMLGAIKTSPDKKTLLVTSDSNGIHLLRRDPLELMRTINDVPNQNQLVAHFSFDGKRLVTHSATKTKRLAVWNVADGTLLHAVEGPLDRVSGTVAPNKNEGIFCSKANGVFHLNIENGKLTKLDSVTAASGVYFNGGKQFATASAPLTILPTYISKKELMAYERPSIHFWDSRTLKKTRSVVDIGRSVLSLAVLDDGKALLVRARRNSVEVYDGNSKESIAELGSHGGSFAFAQLTPDGKQAVAASWDHTASVWDVATGKRLHFLRGHKAPISAGALSVDGKLLATGDSVGEVRIWDLTTGKERFFFGEHDNTIRYCQFSADGKILLTNSEDGRVGQFDLTTGEKTLRLDDKSYYKSAEFSSAGALLMTQGPKPKRARQAEGVTGITEGSRISQDKRNTFSVRIRNQTGKAPVEMKFEQSPEAPHFSSDGKLLIIPSRSAVQIRNPVDGSPIRSLEQTPFAKKADFGPSDQFVATESSAGVLLWNQETGARYLRIDDDQFTAAPISQHFSPDEKLIALRQQDDSVRVLPTNLIEAVRQLAPRDFSEDERKALRIAPLDK